MRRRSIVLLAVGALGLGACTSEQSTEPRPPLTTNAPTTVATTIPETTDPPTTDAPPDTDPPSTDASTTTAPTAVTKEVPLLIGSGTNGWLALGAWQVDHWQGPIDDEGGEIAPSVGDGLAVTISSLSGERTGTLGTSAEACYDDREGPTLGPAVDAPDPPGFGYGAVALPTPTWTLKPRSLVATASGPDSYRQLGQDILDGAGVDTGPGRVVQLVVADLDGDGDDEALVVFEYVQPEPGPGSPGDFAAIFLVDTDTRTASAVLDNVVPTGASPGQLAIEQYRVVDVADYNGDGVMEVAIHRWYYEGAAVGLYGYNGTSLVELAVNGCGA